MWNCQKYQIFGSFLFATNFLSASGDFCCNSVLITKIFFFLLDRFPVNNFWVNSENFPQLHKLKCSAKVKLFFWAFSTELVFVMNRRTLDGQCHYEKLAIVQKSGNFKVSKRCGLLLFYWLALKRYFKYGSIKGCRSIKGGGGGHPDKEGARSPKIFFSALRASVWSKHMGVCGGPPGPLPWIRHWYCLCMITTTLSSTFVPVRCTHLLHFRRVVRLNVSVVVDRDIGSLRWWCWSAV